MIVDGDLQIGVTSIHPQIGNRAGLTAGAVQ